VAGEHARQSYPRAPTRALFAVAGRVVVLTRFGAFRNRLYARMEEISFRTSMTVLGGVVAVAAVIAGVSVLMSQAAPARPAALSPAPASSSAVPTSAPAARPASPSRPAPTSSAPARTQAPAAADPVHEATYPATDEESTPTRAVPATSGRSPAVQRVNSAAAAWADWWRARMSGGGGHAGGYPGEHSGFRGFGNFSGHGPGHR
jgi:hypothetical protein